MKNKTIYFAIIFVLFVSLGIFGLQKDNIAKAETITFEDAEYKVYFYVGLNKSSYSRGETASATVQASVFCNYSADCALSSEDVFSGAVTIAGKEYSLFSYVPIYSLEGYYQVSAPVETTSGAYNATFTIARNGWQTQQVTIPYDVYALTNWSSSNSSIVTIDEHGYAVAKALGTAKITVTYKGKSAYLDIVVSAVPCTPSCGDCSVSCGGGTQTCTAADCSTYSQSCNTQVCLPGNFNLSLGGSVACNSVPLSWTSSSGADAYRILRGSPRVDIYPNPPNPPYTALNYSDTTVSQNTTYQYQIEAYNASGTKRSNEISVPTPYCPPTINLLTNPTSVYQGQSATLSWTTYYTTSCNASGGWSGSKTLSGSEVVKPSPPPSVTYTLVCSGPGGSVTQSITIKITPLALPNWREIIPR